MRGHEEEEDPYAGLVDDIADDVELPEGLEDEASDDDDLPYDLSDEGVALLQQQHDCVSDAYLQALTGQQVRSSCARCRRLAARAAAALPCRARRARWGCCGLRQPHTVCAMCLVWIPCRHSTLLWGTLGRSGPWSMLRVSNPGGGRRGVASCLCGEVRAFVQVATVWSYSVRMTAPAGEPPLGRGDHPTLVAQAHWARRKRRIRNAENIRRVEPSFSLRLLS